MRLSCPLSAVLLVALAVPTAGSALEQRNEVSNLNGPYDAAFFYRENEAFRVGAAIHFAHGIQHDYLQLEPLARHGETDAEADRAYLKMIHDPPRTEPEIELYGPYTRPDDVAALPRHRLDPYPPRGNLRHYGGAEHPVG